MNSASYPSGGTATWAASYNLVLHPWTSRTFPATPDQVGAARRFLTSLLPAGPATDDALICLSELATNSVQHSRSSRPGGTFTVRVRYGWRSVWVAVDDEGGPWQERPDPGPLDPRGRGLLTVRELADHFCVTGSQDGRTASFLLITEPLGRGSGPLTRAPLWAEGSR